MEKLVYVEKIPYRGFKLPNGKIIDLFPCRYDSKIDIENETYISFYEEEYNKSNLPTIQELVNIGIIKEVSCIEKSFRIDFDKNDKRSIDKVIKYSIEKFSENGFNVTEEAIRHNFNAWVLDMKSGYRDNENGYHLFSPCGCNPLSFSATTLHEQCEDWQKTYEC